MGLLSSIGKAVTKSLDTISGIVTNPVTAITKGIAESTKKFQETKPITNVVKTVTNIGIVAGVVAGAAAPAAAASVAKSLIPSSTKGKAIAAIVAPVAVGAVVSQPSKTIEAAINAPSALANVGGNVANLVADPSIENAKKIVTDNPIASTLLGTGATLALAAPLVPALSNAVQNQRVLNELEKQTDAFDRQASAAEKALTASPTAPQTPITPETKPLIASAGSSSSSSSTRKRTRKPQKPYNINQKVNVIVSNKSSVSSKRFISKGAVLY